MRDWRRNVYFVLVEPEEPGNVGASARAIKNMGFRNLRLVRPPDLTTEARWFAHLSLDVLEGAEVFDDLQSAISDISVVVGATRRKGKRRGVFRDIAQGMEPLPSLARKNKVALLFGREKRGLYNEEAALCSYLVTIPADKEHPSLNLSHAVVVAAYELQRAAVGRKGAFEAGTIVPQSDLEVFYGRLAVVLGLLDYPIRGSRSPEKAAMSLMRQMINRAGITPQELTALHAMCTRIEIKLGSEKDV